jgi:hypothetical protein
MSDARVDLVALVVCAQLTGHALVKVLLGTLGLGQERCA